ncbi:MAG: hypothetical protein IJM45_10825 [Clostridia bacterium]|nr:hypothetical protein [Clostridia bacterium]
MIQALTYVYLVFVLIFKTVFPFGLPPKAVPAADTGSLAAVDALGRKAVSAGESKKRTAFTKRSARRISALRATALCCA